MSLETRGKLITFYSYKGGTGRTMALANVACVLAERYVESTDKGVLMIDWDLEAPGLHRFFNNKFHNQFNGVENYERTLDEAPGLIELFINLQEALETDYGRGKSQSEEDAVTLIKSLNLERYILKTDIQRLYLLKSGRFDKEYATRVNTFQWEKLYEQSPWLISVFAARLGKEFQYVLIDSRTGVTDTSGICTMIMPEKLVVVFTPNRQSLTGILELIRRATNYRRNSDDLRHLVAFPLVSRVDLSEQDLHKLWRHGGDPNPEFLGYQAQFETLFEDVYGLQECHLEDYFNEVQIQHVPYYAYGEEIAVLKEPSSARLSLARSYENFTDRLVTLVGPWQILEVADLSDISRISAASVSVLLEMDGMEKPEVRESLVSLGFSRRESSLLDLNRSENMHADLVNIVSFVTKLGKLDRLLFNARAFALNPETKHRINQILRAYQNLAPVLEIQSRQDEVERKFDVFLVYDSRDKEQVRLITEELTRQGLKPWLDEEQISPGQRWQDVIEDALKEVKAVMIIIGQHGLGRWQDSELRLVVIQSIESHLPVIPVLLPGVKAIPTSMMFLNEFSSVRLTSIDDREALDRLVWGITGKRPSSITP